MNSRKRDSLLMGMSKDHRDVCDYTTDPDGEIDLLHLDRPADLIRAIGKLHFLCAERSQRVVFRGQTTLHGGHLMPSLFRGNGSTSLVEHSRRSEILREYLDSAWDPKFRIKYVPEQSSLEPLLQHYGLRSRWIDVVDTVWPALWFATHESNSKEDPNNSTDRFVESKNEHCYIICISFTSKSTSISKDRGVRTFEDCEFIDLRTSVNSIFIRPHCQHGCLIRSLNGNDCWELVQDVIRLPTQSALEWLGQGRMSRESFIFPENDSGLEILTKHVRKPPNTLGNGFM